MPELHFVIDWPDGTPQTCYSPSTIVRDHFEPGARYPIAEFLVRSRTALIAASERVRQRRGAPCSLALAQLAGIEVAAARYPASALVVFRSFGE
ncbi:MSMEG_0570 family nitrogen starvation response protein [Rhodopila sp.]|uniref:MSMEG_0570 family nitrogen starvation response protein n=1 Tax=Rhodopila sp. TaxID=2480087 RepID=UPI003D1436A8